MFDKKILEELDLSEYGLKFADDFTHTNPEDSLIARPLCNTDFEKGFLPLLSQLTALGTVEKEAFLDRFESMIKTGGYYIIVIEDVSKKQIVATGMLEIEQKFIHSCALRGRVEEVVVDGEYRGRRLGKLVLGLVTSLSKKLGCYKTTLECKTENLPFYEKFDYKRDAEHFMQLRFRD